MRLNLGLAILAPMTIEAKLIWTEGTDEEPRPTLEAVVDGATLGQFDTIDEALANLKRAFIVSIQSSCCEECAALYGGQFERPLRHRWTFGF
jgi:hypothetical protein